MPWAQASLLPVWGDKGRLAVRSETDTEDGWAEQLSQGFLSL